MLGQGCAGAEPSRGMFEVNPRHDVGTRSEMHRSKDDNREQLQGDHRARVAVLWRVILSHGAY